MTTLSNEFFWSLTRFLLRDVSTALESTHSIYGELLELSLYGSLELTQLLEENISTVLVTHLLTQTLLFFEIGSYVRWLSTGPCFSLTLEAGDSRSLSTNLYVIDRKMGTPLHRE